MIITQPKELIGAFVNVQQGQPAHSSWGTFNAIGLVIKERLVAGVIYNTHEAANSYMHVAGLHFTPDFLFAVFDYPFNELRKERVTAFINAGNKKAIKLVKHLGFKPEGRLRKYYGTEDAVIYGMLKSECRFLEMRKAA